MSDDNTTPRPWHIGNFEGDVQYIYANTPKFEPIAKELKPADATLIVTAVNAHDDLVKALEAFLEWNEAEEHQSPVWATGERKRPDFWERVEMFGVARDFARSALAKSKGEKT